jgi:two-component system, NarL family, nitrate/nitrite response regulator NarL
MTDHDDKGIRIIIVDDHAMVRAGLRMLIEQEPDLQIVGEAEDLEAAVRLTTREQPDLILLDLDMAGKNGLDILPDLLTTVRGGHVLVLTGISDPGAHREAIRSGAAGVLMKSQAAHVLIKAIRKVHAGEPWVDRITMTHVLAELRVKDRRQEPDPEQVKIATLTEREREVLDLVCKGLKNREIAERLFISDHTVRHHIGAIFSKLDVSGRLELILYAYRNRLAHPPEVLT